jgi:tetratricopeptide (TPR) repeat protein
MRNISAIGRTRHGKTSLPPPPPPYFNLISSSASSQVIDNKQDAERSYYLTSKQKAVKRRFFDAKLAVFEALLPETDHFITSRFTISASQNRPTPFALTLLVACIFSCCLHAQTAPSSSDSEATRLMQSGASAIHQGKTADAEALFRQATQVAPRLPDAYLGLGMSELREGKVDEAQSAFTKALELNPAVPGAHMFLGIAQYQMNKLDAATASLKQEIAQQPDNVEALTWLGIVELGSGHASEAVVPLDRAAALSPKDPNILDYRGRAHSLVAQESYRALTSLDPDSWRVHRALGEVYSESRDWQNAITEYQKAIDRQPNNADLYEALGDSLQRLSRFDDATHAYETELKLSPHSSNTLYNLGKIQVERGDAQRGVTLLRQAAAVSAPSAPISFYLGRGLIDTGHPDDGVKWLEKTLAQEPSDYMKESAYFQLARAYKMLNRTDDAKRAADELQKLKSAPSKPGEMR